MVARAAIVPAVAILLGCSPASPLRDEAGSEGIELPSRATDGAPYVEPSSGADDADATTDALPPADGTTSVGPTSFEPTPLDTTGDEVPPETFEEPPPFGDDVRETDLVGTWGLPWDPAGQADITLTIDAAGGFTWRETSADCSVERWSSGRLWVEGTQLVLAVEEWDKRLPWPDLDAVDFAVEVPFRLRLGYATMGPYLGVAGPEQLSSMFDWPGQSFARVAAGAGPGGQWVSESELWALRPGAGAQLVVRDRYQADLQAEGASILRRARTQWWPSGGPVAEPIVEGEGTWEDETPGQTAGAATIAGEPFAYDAVHLIGFAPERSFELGVSSDCR